MVSAARWVLECAAGELPDEVLTQLRAVLASYDDALRRIAEGSRGDGGSRD